MSDVTIRAGCVEWACAPCTAIAHPCDNTPLPLTQRPIKHCSFLSAGPCTQSLQCLLFEGPGGHGPAVYTYTGASMSPQRGVAFYIPSTGKLR